MGDFKSIEGLVIGKLYGIYKELIYEFCGMGPLSLRPN